MKSEKRLPNRRGLERWAGLSVVVLLIGGATVGFALSRMMSQPLYRFGSVREGVALSGPLNPPEQTDAARWQVEHEISLAFEVHGEGDPVLVVHGRARCAV